MIKLKAFLTVFFACVMMAVIFGVAGFAASYLVMVMALFDTDIGAGYGAARFIGGVMMVVGFSCGVSAAVQGESYQTLIKKHKNSK